MGPTTSEKSPPISAKPMKTMVPNEGRRANTDGHFIPRYLLMCRQLELINKITSKRAVGIDMLIRCKLHTHSAHICPWNSAYSTHPSH